MISFYDDDVGAVNVSRRELAVFIFSSFLFAGRHVNRRVVSDDVNKKRPGRV